jgi:hypothetical protein
VTPKHRLPDSGPGRLARIRTALAAQVRRLPLARTGKGRLIAGGVLVVAVLAGGSGIAVAASHNLANHSAPDVADRTLDDRANRDYVRPDASGGASATGSPSAQPTSPVPSATATPTTPAAKPTTTAPTPKQTTTTRAAVPAGCSSYHGNQLTACQLLPSFGFSTSEMSALVPMWNKESSWDETAENPSSGAYGIPQALPGTKMATAGSDWRTNPATQIKWGLGYIKSVYGSPSAAWSFWQNNNWY